MKVREYVLAFPSGTKRFAVLYVLESKTFSSISNGELILDVIDESEVHPVKALAPICLIVEGKVIDFNPTRFSKALFAILTVPEVKVILVTSPRPPLKQKATFPAYTTCPLGLLSSQAVFEKALLPMLITELGISMLLREVQPLKHSEPIDVTPLGMSIYVRDLHFSNASLSIFVKLEGK